MTASPADTLAAVLAQHSGFVVTERRLMRTDCYYECVCGHRYEQYQSTRIANGQGYQSGNVVPDPDQRRRIFDLHHKHQSGAIIAADLEIPTDAAPSRPATEQLTHFRLSISINDRPYSPRKQQVPNDQHQAL